MNIGGALKDLYKSPIARGAAIGATAQGGLAYAVSDEKLHRKDPMFMLKTREKAHKKGIEISKDNPEWKDHISSEARKGRIKNTIVGALGGGMLGGSFGHDLGRRSGYGYRRQNYGGNAGPARGTGFKGGFSAAQKATGLSGSEKTKAEVKRKFRVTAMKNHPDRGGSTDQMADINNAWEEVQKSSWFSKLAFLRGFEKQAEEEKKKKGNLGKVIGGTALAGERFWLDAR